MPKKVNPYSSKEGAVYHVYADCPLGSKIPKHNKVAGQGGKKLCSFCKKLAKPVAKAKAKVKAKSKKR